MPPDRTRYFHGGPPINGRWLLPPATTGQARTCHQDPHVYITPHYSLALTYAATCDGWVYEVVPEGQVQQDPDSSLPPGDSMRCTSARIVRRVRPPRREREAALKAMTAAVTIMGDHRA